MIKIKTHVCFESGSPQFRIMETTDPEAPVYQIYSQNDLQEDLTGVILNCGESKKIRTEDTVNILSAGDVVFSLISGTAAIVSETHSGYLYTQNYIKIFMDGAFDAAFLIYLLNEDRLIRKQLQMGLQGSSILKYTLKQLKELEVWCLPDMNRQKKIGEIYLKQLKTEALKKRAAEEERELVLARLGELFYERNGI